MSFDKKIKSLDNLSLQFKENQITGLIGFNGSGKTTTFNIIADFLTNYTGNVEIDGVIFGEPSNQYKEKYLKEKNQVKNEIIEINRQIAKMDKKIKKIKGLIKKGLDDIDVNEAKNISNIKEKKSLLKQKEMLKQSPELKSVESRKMGIKQTMAFLGASIPSRDTSRVMVYLKKMGFIYGLNGREVEIKANKLAAQMNFTQFLNKPIKSLSKGNQQKIKVISSLLNPRLKYLILDEPFDGLDPVMVESIKKIFLELKKITIIITSHRMEVVQSMCKEFYVLKDGVLIDARTTNDEKVTLSVNKGVSMVSIKKLKCVLDVKDSGDKIIILIDSMDNFKVVNKKLIADKKYIYSSFEEKNISAAVFEGYGK